MTLPPAFADWFARNGRAPHPHQLALLEAARDTLLIAPTGGGKTLAGFPSSLVDLHGRAPKGLHTLYVSPLKALTADVARNLMRPTLGIGLAVRIEDRTGDTPQGQRRRQRAELVPTYPAICIWSSPLPAAAGAVSRWGRST